MSSLPRFPGPLVNTIPSIVPPCLSDPQFSRPKESNPRGTARVLLSILTLNFKSFNPQPGQDLLQPQLKTGWKIFGSCWHRPDCFPFKKHKPLPISIAIPKWGYRSLQLHLRRTSELVSFFTSHFGYSESRDLFSK